MNEQLDKLMNKNDQKVVKELGPINNSKTAKGQGYTVRKL